MVMVGGRLVFRGAVGRQMQAENGTGRCGRGMSQMRRKIEGWSCLPVRIEFLSSHLEHLYTFDERITRYDARLASLATLTFVPR